MSLSVKITFQSKQQQARGATAKDAYEFVEARRFAIEEDVASNYDYFRAKVVSIIPSLKNRAFRLYWKDNEDDTVVFSSDEELVEALGHVPNNSDCLFRVYVRQVDDEVKSSSTARCCNSSISVPPLHLLFGGLGGCHMACRVPRRTACFGARCTPGASPWCGAKATADGTHGNNSSPTENQRKTGDGHDVPACDGHHEKMNKAEPGCSKTDRSTGRTGVCGGGDGQHQRIAGDFISNMADVIGSLLSSRGSSERNNQSHRPADNSQHNESSKQQTHDVSGNGATNVNRNSRISTNQMPETRAAGLIQVVETLKEMGFKDDDGSLSRLVSTHGGQIERIIHFMETCHTSC